MRIFLSIFIICSYQSLGLANSCEQSEISQTQMLLSFFKTEKKLDIPHCFSDQQDLLKSFGFQFPVKDHPLRIFLLKEFLIGSGNLRAIIPLVKSSLPEDQAVVQEISELHFTINRFKNDNDLSDKPTEYLDGVFYYASCDFGDEVCSLKEHIRANIKFLQTQQRQAWAQIRDSTLESVRDGKIPPADEGTKEEKDFTAVEKAHFILTLRPSLDIFSETEKEKIRYFDLIYNQSIADFYQGNNKKALVMRAFSKDMSSTGILQTETIDQIAKSVRYLNGAWKGGPEVSLIAAEDSMSPIRALMGPGASRVTYWPSTGLDKNNDLGADLRFVRISSMLDAQGVLRAIEFIARDVFTPNLETDKNSGWEPFVYEKQWGRWFPSQKINNKVAVKDFCIRCHTTTEGAFSPRPLNVGGAEVFEKIGYKNKSIIQEMMTY